MSRRKNAGIVLAIAVALAAVAFTYRDQILELQEHAAGHGINLQTPKWLSSWKASSQQTLRHHKEKEPRIGEQLFSKGLRPTHPVIIIPGFVTSGLQLWAGHNCSADFYRRRIWGSLEMGKTALQDLDCWLQHMALDPKTGGDPEGIKLRACEGLDAIEFFMPGYAVWGKLTEALSDVGYDTNTLVTETYDWRLAVPLMQQRDNYFTRLKLRVELLHSLHQTKLVLVSHSWGDNVFRNFLTWVGEQDQGWCEEHIHSYVNIAGPTLGVPKSVSTYLSGETRDTAELGAITGLLSNKVVPAAKRLSLFRTWGAGIGMLPNGGPAIWGNSSFAPDDTPAMIEEGQTYGAYITEAMVDQEELAQLESHRSSWFKTLFLGRPSAAMRLAQKIRLHDVGAAVQLMLANADKSFQEHVRLWGAVHAVPSSRKCSADPGNYYFDPLKCPLPNAPSMNLYCLYGIGVPTERSYYYVHRGSENATDGRGDQLWSINHEMKQSCNGSMVGSVDHGIRFADGDATVPLISLGALCRKHWRHKSLNPSGIRIVSREHPHEPVNLFKDLRGGGKSADHVDILSNDGVLTDIIKIATGHTEEMDDKIHSAIDDIVARIPIGAD